MGRGGAGWFHVRIGIRHSTFGRGVLSFAFVQRRAALCHTLSQTFDCTRSPPARPPTHAHAHSRQFPLRMLFLSLSLSLSLWVLLKTHSASGTLKFAAPRLVSSRLVSLLFNIATLVARRSSVSSARGQRQWKNKRERERERDNCNCSSLTFWFVCY